MDRAALDARRVTLRQQLGEARAMALRIEGALALLGEIIAETADNDSGQAPQGVENGGNNHADDRRDAPARK